MPINCLINVAVISEHFAHFVFKTRMHSCCAGFYARCCAEWLCIVLCRVCVGFEAQTLHFVRHKESAKCKVECRVYV